MKSSPPEVSKKLIVRVGRSQRLGHNYLVRQFAALLAFASLAPCAFSQFNPASWSFNSATAWGYLIKQVSYGPRVPGTPAQIQCRDWLLDELKQNCDEVHIQELSHHWTYNDKDVPVYNVIGTQDWKDAKVRVVLLAHWDSRPFADGPNSPAGDLNKPIPGADDGASGAAVLLELARAIKGKHPGVGITFLLDDGEDLGPSIQEMLLGVDYYAGHLTDPKPDYGILLDMIGQKNLVVPMEQTSMAKAPSVVKAFYANAAQVGLGDFFPSRTGDDVDDDHIPLINRGIPTMDLIDFQYPFWHTIQDTPEHCSEAALEATGVALESFLEKNPSFMP
jgi:glutaminyl-peptide cyclotransferase